MHFHPCSLYLYASGPTNTKSKQSDLLILCFADKYLTRRKTTKSLDVYACIIKENKTFLF